MEKFCYWQEDCPNYEQIQFLIKKEKICLFRQNEFQFNNKVNIFCPYENSKKAEECPEYKVSKQFYE